MRVEGKNVVVTGAANGIGLALVERFVAEGAARVVAADLDGDAVAALADRVGAVAVAVDVADEAQMTELVARSEAMNGPIDLFCSNAGVGGDGGIDAPDAVWQRNWDVNVMAHVYAARAVVPSMVERGGGYLLQTVSAAGLLSSPGAGPYATAKHAAIGLAEWLAITYGSSGIKVSCLCPQAVRTKLLMNESAPAVRDAMLAIAPPMEPSQVADSVIVGLGDERFLILPHPEVSEYYRAKAADPDRWLSGMRRFIARSRIGGGEPSN